MSNQEQMLRRFIHVAPFVLGLLILFILINTSPRTVGPAGIFGVFLLLYVFFLSLLYSLTHLVINIIRRMQPNVSLPARKMYYLATVGAFVPVFLLALNTLGQLRAMDVLLVLSLGLVLGFYVLRRTE